LYAWVESGDIPQRGAAVEKEKLQSFRGLKIAN
jgi:hypothetical protein